MLTMMIPAIHELIGVKRLGLRSCFCKRRSRSRKRSPKNAYDLVKIKSQKNQNVSISSDSAYDSVAYVPLMI